MQCTFLRQDVCLILGFQSIGDALTKKVKKAYKTLLHAICETHMTPDPNNEGRAVHISAPGDLNLACTSWNFAPLSGHRSSNIRINHLHERALRIVYKDNESTFEDLPKKDNSVSIHHKNIRLLGIELYKVKNNLSTHLMSEIFNLRNIDYDLRS